MKYILVSLVLACLVASAFGFNNQQSLPLHKLAGCNATCADNNGCTSLNCSRCVEYQCRKGLPCNIKGCTTNSDCDQSGSCTLCSNGTCHSAGQCLDHCATNADCHGQCKECMDNKCVSICNNFCNSSAECEYKGSRCAKCIDQRCQAGGCGSVCLYDSDCAGEGNCTTCKSQRCVSDCGKPCAHSWECGGGVTGCGLCSNGTCTRGVCGSACPIGNNNACLGPDSTCTLCSERGTCIAGFACGATCKVNAECDQSAKSECKFCNKGKCSRI